jgi:hypothetical protein
MVTYSGIDRINLLKQIGYEFPNGNGVEIGTFKGEFSKEILNNWNGTLYMIDVWRPLGEEYVDMSNHKDHINAYSETMDNISGFEDRAVMIRATSKVASKLFVDNSLDFAYIDANHAYDFVKEDIELWYPKVKKGGYLCGHDYLDLDWYNDPNFLENKKDKHIWGNNTYHGMFGVNPAVDEFCKEHGYDLTLTSEWFGTWLIQKK